MRNYDNWNRYLDNKGNPLHGCVQFMVKDGNTIAPIYDSDGTSLVNPQITDIYGRTEHQVFIIEDVVAYFYAYIGDGIWNTELNIDTSDQTKWALQYTIENQSSSKISIETDAAICVPTVSALRELDVEQVPSIGEIKTITLLGYNRLGDKEPINYYWDEHETAPDDEGSIIKNNTLITGRWIMVQPTEHCDTRHFGVFPSNSYNMEDQTYRINKVIDYCNSKSIRPFFNGSEEYRWFRYNNLNINIDYIDVTDNTQFYDTGSSTITAEWNGNPRFYNSNTNLVCTNVKTSWNANSYTSYKNVIIDEATSQRNWQNCHIDMRLNPATGFNFNHCTFTPNHNLSTGNTFNDCHLTASMFITSNSTQSPTFSNGNATNCTFDISDWSGNDIEKLCYIQLRITNNSNPNFDYEGMSSANNPLNNYGASIISGSIIKLMNYNLSSGSATLGRLSNANTLIIDNCRGTYNLSVWNNYKVIVKDCESITLTGLYPYLDLEIINSTATILPNSMVKKFTITDSTVNKSSSTTMSCTNGFDAIGSTIDLNISTSFMKIKDCIVESGVYTMVYDNSLSSRLTVDNNEWNASLILSGKSGGTHHANRTFITNNIGKNSNPVVINRTNLSSTESSHTYTYENNRGTFLKSDNINFNTTITLGNDYNTAISTDNYMSIYGSGDPAICFIADSSYYYSNPSARHGFSNTFNIFRIGTDSFRTSIRWRITSSDSTTIDNAWARWLVFPIEFNMTAQNTSGFTYRLDVDCPPFQQGANTTFFTMTAIPEWAAHDMAGMTFTGVQIAVTVSKNP